uniref:NADH-ubiquinone oxidoreductase chain 6 n=1 Tax=Chascanopsetta lugubris TaxID=1003706 RepID=A0A1N7T5N8_9PLEU|nr:NADH dehydrogenase subunit 6 [Chascanopsetta lugubris]AID59783.1 NADH dehydrogenase subunit 6 [Chascanopsetta lugubris]BAX03940.1 NADH dehydrogenase subunit 6 [Chascanopsetta lugubris]
MTFIMWLVLFCFVVALVAVASNPSPYFAALGLVAAASVGCALLTGYGGSFLSLVLLLIYLGGMLVVFAYSVALAAEPYPEAWGSLPVLTNTLLLMVAAVGMSLVLWGGWYEASWMGADDTEEFPATRGDMDGVALMYSSAAGLLVAGAAALFLTLLVVLELTRGLSRGALRTI